jgi:hypothetical protein
MLETADVFAAARLSRPVGIDLVEIKASFLIAALAGASAAVVAAIRGLQVAGLCSVSVTEVTFSMVLWATAAVF